MCRMNTNSDVPLVFLSILLFFTVFREKHINQELQSIYQITRKQFKQEKSPNMLLWDEKQQIKTLHDEDPEKWTCMRLAFSFPATPSIIQVEIKSCNGELSSNSGQWRSLASATNKPKLPC